MTTITAQIVNLDNAEKDLSGSVSEILRGCTLMAMASSLSNNGGGYANTAYFSYDADLHLYFISDETTQHCFNITNNPHVSVVMWLPPSTFAEGLRGLQLFGRCMRAEKEQAVQGLKIHKQRFPNFQPSTAAEADYLNGTGQSGLFVIETNKLKLIDEPRFGRRNYIEAIIERH